MNLPIHACGGTISVATSPEDGADYHACALCAAFAFDPRPVPTGTDRDANMAAWDAGDLTSPDAATAEEE